MSLPSLVQYTPQEFDTWMKWDTNPVYAVLHEPIYCQGEASNWAAHRVREAEFRDEFDAAAAAAEGRPVNFTGEMVFPWMFDEIAGLRAFKDAAEALAAKSDWPALYDVEKLSENVVPAATVMYFEDMFVNFDLANVRFGEKGGRGVQVGQALD